MAEVHIIGQVVSATGFPSHNLFCKWGIHAGGGWRVIEGLTEGQTHVDSPSWQEQAIWSHPFDVHFATKGIQGWPKINLQVYHYDRFGRSEVYGYGFCYIPSSPGAHKLDVVMWRPVGTLAEQFKQHFLGGGAQLKTPDLVHSATDRYRLQTETMGSVHLELSVILRELAIVLILLSMQVVGQTTSNNGGSHSVSSATEATCGIGSNACPTGQTSESSEAQDTGSTTSSSTTLEEPTSISPQEANVTHSATTVAENGAKSTTQATTPRQQKAPSTTAHTPTLGPVVKKSPVEQASGLYAHSGTCACDLTAYSCDINCCCDPECTRPQRASFSSCKSIGYIPYNNRYCFATKLVFLNNSEHILQQTQNGAFCIVRSNLAGSILYPPLSMFVTYQEFAKHWDRSHSSSWPELSSPKTVDKPKLYVAGYPLWVLLNNQVHDFELPSSGLSDACSVASPVQYLFPRSSQCLQKVPSSQTECGKVSSEIHQQIQNIVRSPPLVNQTQLASENIEPCVSNICVPITYFLCEATTLLENYSNECKNISNRKILFGYKSGVCYNIVKKMRLVLHHNGTSGIEYAEAYLWLFNMTTTTNGTNIGQIVKTFHQSISVDFVWLSRNLTRSEHTNNSSLSHSTNFTSARNDIPFARSGNPGYIVGKPVIAGFRVKQKSSLNVTRDPSKESRTVTKDDMVELSYDPKQWLTLPVSNYHGFCDWSKAKRHVVTFGEDVHMSCGVTILPQNISSYFSCNLLRARMLYLLLGNVSRSFQNSTLQTDWGRVVAAFGRANVSVAQDWVPLLWDSQSSYSLLQTLMSVSDSKATPQEDSDRPLQMCENIPLGTQLRIMHGLVGTSSNPQSKILGATIRFTPMQDIGLTCASETCFQKSKRLHFRIVSTVKFIDVTSPAVTKFAEPPAIHIRLPPDFFYPFMASENSGAMPRHGASLVLILYSSLLFYLLWH